MARSTHALIKNTFRKLIKQNTVDGIQNTENSVYRFFRLFCLLSTVSCLLSSCGPKYTYPAAKVPESIEKICKDEHQLNVTARIVGKTAGALLVLESMLDDKDQIGKEVYEQMSKVMMAITRVALSSDRELDFCKVIIRDKADTSELIVVRSIEDSRRAQGDAIGPEESMNRTLFSQEKVQPRVEGDSGEFVLQEVFMEDFLADQITQRLRFEVMKSSKEETAVSGQPLILVDGAFDTAYGKRTFRFSILSLKPDRSNDLMRRVFRMVTNVLAGYKFVAYDDLEINDYLNRRRLIVEQDVVRRYLARTIKEDEIIEQFTTEAPAIHEAFKLFGIDLPESPDGQKPRTIAPTV